MRTSLLLVLVIGLDLSGADDSVKKILKENIEHVSRFLKHQLVSDVKNNNKKIGVSMNLTRDMANKILDYVDKAMAETAGKVQNTLKNMSNKMSTNFKQIQETNLDNLRSIQKLFMENQVSVTDDFTSKLTIVLDKFQRIMTQHEDFMATSAAVCAEAYSHMSRGTVKYSSIFLDSVLIKGEKVKGLLDYKSGDFVVPPGGDGIYHISFGVLIDTVSPRAGISRARQPPRFAVKSSHGNKIRLQKASQVTATVGVKNQYRDLVPASRSLMLSLQAGDIVSLEQMNNHAEQAYRITFCIHLAHPSGMAAIAREEIITTAEAPVMKIATTYVEPIIEEVEINDLKSSARKPDFHLPVLEALKSPTSQFVAGQPENMQYNPLEQEDPYAFILVDNDASETGSGQGSGYE